MPTANPGPLICGVWGYPMDWAPIIPVAVGGLIALAGGALAEFGSGLRARRAERVASALRLDTRDLELWELSLPAAGRVREGFSAAMSSATPPSPWEPQQGPDFDDYFSEWWDDKEAALSNDVALIPNPQFRAALAIVGRAVAWGWALHRHAPFASNYRASVLGTSRVGFDIASAWMRGERDLGADLETQVDELSAALGKMDAALASERSD
jgi:hypothetical protein